MHLCFVLSNNSVILSSGEKISLKNISAKEESEEGDEFHDSQKCLRQSSSKKFSKKISWILYVFHLFSNLKEVFSFPRGCGFGYLNARMKVSLK